MNMKNSPILLIGRSIENTGLIRQRTILKSNKILLGQAGNNVYSQRHYNSIKSKSHKAMQ